MTRNNLFIVQKLLLIMFFFSAGIAPAFSQQGVRLKGKVVDNNGRGLEGVTVTIRQPDSTSVVVTISNDEGLFTLNGLKTTKYNIFFSSPGYEDQEEKNIEVNGDYDNSILIRMYEKSKKRSKQ